jgi:predicted dehydrogenase
MVTDEKQIQQVLDAERKTGEKTRVGHNSISSPSSGKLWELLRSGEIGEITSVDYAEYLDVNHGADYFRRWHGMVENSGSLLLHKSSHHFASLNYYIDSDPVSVYATGSLDNYGKNGPFRAKNCRTCPHTSQCSYYMQMEPQMSGEMQRNAMESQETFKKLYIDCEKYDGYLRDGCVFRNEINIPDKTAATIKYANGVQVAYSLVAYSPYEGSRMVITGTKGRIETGGTNPLQQRSNGFFLYKNFGKPEIIQTPRGTGSHGGSDNLLRDQIFIPGTPDPYQQCANTRDGAFACLIGIAARNSIASGQPVKIAGMTSLNPQVKKEYRRDVLI